MSSGKNSWTREVVCQVVIPIRIDPKATDEEAVEQVKQLIKERSNGVLTLDQLTIFALPLEDAKKEDLSIGITGKELGSMGSLMGVTDEDVEDYLRNIRG